MKTEIVKTKFLCKNGSRVSPKNWILNSSNENLQWKDRFIENKWYEGEYETWSFEDGYRINGGWRRYWVINELGEKEEISRAHMKAIFEFDLDKLRDNKLDEILKNSPE